jgi:CO/xanthine dehydrogenase FAD-binding subunit
MSPVKPPAFEYHDPATLAEALDVLAGHGADAKVLAGGQSLVPLLNLRLARPACLVDLNRIEELAYLRLEDGSLRIGSMTRHSQLERSPDVGRRVPLLREAVQLVGHAQIRNRGTVGGSAAHADPAAELPAAFAALGARFHTRSQRGGRSLGAGEFFRSYWTTALAPDELLVEIEVPVPPPGGHAFAEYARRHGDFALGGAAVQLRLDEAGRCAEAAIALLAAGPVPLRRPEVEAWLAGRVLDEETAREAAERAAADVTPAGDVHGSGEYRREVVEAMARRALLAAAGRAAA